MVAAKFSRRQDVCGDASGDGRQAGVQEKDARQERIRLQVLSATLHQALQPHDPRAVAQRERHVLMRGLRQTLQEAG